MDHPCRRDTSNSRPPNPVAAENALLADIANAPDPFDGATPADVRSCAVPEVGMVNRIEKMLSDQVQIALSAVIIGLLDANMSFAAVEVRKWQKDPAWLAKLGVTLP